MTNIGQLDRVIIEIQRMLLKNENLKKLLKYNTPDALSGAAVERSEVIDFVKTTPAVYMVEEGQELQYNSFAVVYTPTIMFSNSLNDITFIVDLFTRKEILQLDNNQLRLHQMLSEATVALENQRLSFAGRIRLVSATYIVSGNYYVGFQLEMNVIDEAIENDF